MNKLSSGFDDKSKLQTWVEHDDNFWNSKVLILKN